MAKLIIPKEDLPNVLDSSGPTYIRFRVVSEDKNRVSAWTPIFTTDPQFQYFVDGDITLLYTDAGAVSVSWDSVSIMKDVNGTDGANPGNWIYQGRMATNSLSITVPTLYTYGISSTATPYYFYIEVYRQSKEKLQNSASSLLVYSGSVSLTLSTIQETQQISLLLATMI